jgi:hypothetical protein
MASEKRMWDVLDSDAGCRRWACGAGSESVGDTVVGGSKEHFGELVQLDGSFHAWLEERGPEGCLIDLVDDATNTTWAQLGEQETIWAVADALRAWIERFRLESERTIGEDWVVHYSNRFFQLGTASRHFAPAGDKVLVCEGRHGSLAIEYRGRYAGRRSRHRPGRR